MIRFPLLFVLCWICNFLHAEEDGLSVICVSASEGLPSSIVNGSVCAITGAYVDFSQDLVMEGPEKLVLNRSYCSHRTDAVLGIGWGLNHSDRIQYFTQTNGKKVTLVANVKQQTGSVLQYYHEAHKQVPQYCLPRLKIPSGLTNTSRGEISGRTNVKNDRVSLAVDHLCEITGGDGVKRFFMNLPKKYTMVETLRRTTIGNEIHYDIDPKGGLKGIRSCSGAGNIYGCIFCSGKAAGPYDIYTFQATSGETITYRLMIRSYTVKEKDVHGFEGKRTINLRFLDQIERSNGPTEQFSYQEKESIPHYYQIVEKKKPDNRFLKINYYKRGDNSAGVKIKDKDDWRIDRVKTLQAPVGHNNTPIITHQFFYHTGKTDVLDVNGTKTSYHYDGESRLTWIEKFNRAGIGYSSEQYLWGIGEDNGNLKGVHYHGGGRVYLSKSFDYDPFGNIKREVIRGNISGLGEDQYAKYFEYSIDGLNLPVRMVEDNGNEVICTYDGKGLLTKQLILHGGVVKKRVFFQHDAFGDVKVKIVDDGSSDDPENLSDVTERHITRFWRRVHQPTGIPERTDESYLDLTTGKEILLKRVIYHCNAQGQFERQDIYVGEHGVYSHSLHWKYNAHGKEIYHKNAIGEVIEREYDANDNKIEETTASCKTVYAYDFMNRLIWEDKQYADGNHPRVHFKYDLLNNCTGITDPFGCETHIAYDEFNRKTKVTHPAALNEKGKMVRAEETFDYDHVGNVIREVSPNGGITETAYNCHGKPTQMIYPDGSVEKIEYHLNGWIAAKTAKNGTVTRYKQDGFGNVISTEEYSPAGELLRKTTAVYNAFHLLSSTDADGLETSYTYDGAGRLISKVTGEHKTTFEYDDWGRVFKTYDWISNGSARVTVTLYDLLDRVTEERTEDLQENIFSITKREYDDRGNIVRFQEGESITRTAYDSQNRPTEIIDPLGYVTHIEYNEAFRNAYGQQVIQKTETDPLGNQTITTYDTLKREVSICKKDPFSKLVFHQEILYNTANNPCVVTDHRLVNGETQRKIVTVKEYSLANQLIAQTEALGTPEQKITRYTYNTQGELEKITKNDGVVLIHTYDPLGRLSSVVSTDGTLFLDYTYNHQDLVITSSDGTLTTKREYDDYGRLIQEVLANGMTMTYTYDPLDRPLTVEFLDKSLRYTYDEFALKSVETDQDSHEIVKRNLCGDPLLLKLMNGTEVAYEYDLAGQCFAIEHPSFTQTAKYDPLGNLLATVLNREGKQYTYDALSQLLEENNHTYAYDSLGNRTDHNGSENTFNSLNQISDEGFLYDRLGNLIQDLNNTYTYDVLDRLIQVKTPISTIRYAYDTFGRRVSKAIDGQITYYLYQGEEEIGSYQNGKLREMRLLGERARAVVMELDGIAYTPLYDLSNNVVCLLDRTGNLVKQYNYNAYSEEVDAQEELTGFFDYVKYYTGLKAGPIQNPWRYASKRTDPETGFVYFGKRYYSPDLGRWITADPLGFADGPNLYAYVHNNPLRYYDAQGLFSLNFGHFANISDIDSDFPSYTPWSSSLPTVLRYDSFEKLQPWCPESKNYELGLDDIPGKSITFINGIWTNQNGLYKHMDYLSKFTNGSNIHGTHNPTGYVMDVPECWLGLNHIATSPVQLLHQKWDELFDRNPTDFSILQICHSQGAIHVRNALLSYSEERRQRISVVAIAPAGYIYEHTCKSVVHYRAEPWRDLIPYLDVEGAIRERRNTVTLPSQPGVSLHDHDFQSLTYHEALQYEIDNYVLSEGRYAK